MMEAVHSAVEVLAMAAEADLLVDQWQREAKVRL